MSVDFGRLGVLPSTIPFLWLLASRVNSPHTSTYWGMTANGVEADVVFVVGFRRCFEIY